MLVAALIAAIAVGCGTSPPGTNGSLPPSWDEGRWEVSVAGARVPVYGYRVVREYPHSTDSFTQGLVMRDGFFYEGTGRYGHSSLMKIEPATGHVVLRRDLDPRFFGEGVAIMGDELFQLTYKNNTGFVYELDGFGPLRSFSYLTEGWGLTGDGSSLIMSDGSAMLRFLDPDTLELEKSVTVSDFAGPVDLLNELEYIDGEIYANIWKQDCIVRISPGDGRVTGWIDLTGLNPIPAGSRGENVLNGIAFDRESGHLVVTGKCWPSLYEIELVER